MRAARACMTLFAVVAAGCGGGDGGTGPGPGPGPGPLTCTSTSASVTVANNSFSPRCTTVGTGTTVTWTWNSGGTLHNVTFTSGSSSDDQGSGTFQRTFPSVGTFAYTCTIHGGSMSGEIRVQ